MRFLLVGHPVEHSLSPVIHQAAYRELGEAHEYALFDAADEASVDGVVAALRRAELSGANVTIPWKRRAFALADRRSELAELLKVVNVLSPDSGQVVGHNTDVLALEAEFGRLSGASRAIVLGSGGAVPAVVAACRAAGISEVFVTARRFTPDAPASTWPGAEELGRLGARPIAWPAANRQAAQVFHELAQGTQLVVQGTSAGMRGADSGEPLAELVPWAALPKEALAYDLIYAPLETPFLRAARRAGLRGEHGLSMLVGQAVLSVEIWLGRRPPIEPLMHAALLALSARGER